MYTREYGDITSKGVGGRDAAFKRTPYKDVPVSPEGRMPGATRNVFTASLGSGISIPYGLFENRIIPIL